MLILLLIAEEAVARGGGGRGRGGGGALFLAPVMLVLVFLAIAPLLIPLLRIALAICFLTAFCMVVAQLLIWTGLVPKHLDSEAAWAVFAILAGIQIAREW